MFPIVPTHLTVRHHRSGAAGHTSSVSSSTDSATSGRHHPIWNMWNATLMDYKPARTPKRPAKAQTPSITPIFAAGCVAATNLPRDSQSAQLEVLNRSPLQFNSDQQNSSKPLLIGISPRGVLRCESDEDHPNTNVWITEVRLADDVHSNNVLAEVHSINGGRKELRVRVVRSIDAGESLVLWFSEELLAMMNIPFLTPACIRGKNSYTCQTCEETFEYPNPLKIHMATGCGRRPQQELWMRVECSLNKENLVASATSPSFMPVPTSLSPSSLAASPAHHLPSWFINHQYHLHHQQRALLLQHHQQNQFLALPETPALRHIHPPLTRLSAFQPVTTKQQTSEPTSSSPIRTSSPMRQFTNPFSYPHLTPINSFQALDPAHVFASPPHHQHLHTDPSDANTAAAHLETIVSNMGTAGSALKPGGSSGSGGGHLCIYCGKVYSRKYGLKIHIRTHTGFKPLKCKYCFRPFGDPSNLNKHVRLHVQGSTIYKCPEPQCDKILVRRRDLQRHMQTRHSSGMDGGDAGDPVRSEGDDSDAEGSAKRRRCGSSSPSSVASSSFEVHEDVLSTDEEDLIKVDQ